jgi:hypothetical protein
MNLQEYNRVVGALSHEFAETELDPLLHFPWAIKRMNTMYSLPINQTPTLDGLNESPVTRLAGFLKTFRAEISEGLDIEAYLIVREMLQKNEPVGNAQITDVIDKLGIKDAAHVAKLHASIVALIETNDPEEFDRQVLVMLADWFADMVVYIRSEALKFGIPLESILAVVMGSNFTKLNSDGEPIKDSNGKVLKGPNFVPPEQHIYATMFEQDELMEQAAAVAEQMNSLNAVAIPVLANPVAEVFHEHDDYEELEEYDAEPETIDDTPRVKSELLPD